MVTTVAPAKQIAMEKAIVGLEFYIVTIEVGVKPKGVHGGVTQNFWRIELIKIHTRDASTDFQLFGDEIVTDLGVIAPVITG